MGLDTIEIILRTEEVFGISLPDSDCAQVRTVGDLYRLVLDKLGLGYIPTKQIEPSTVVFSRFRSSTRRMFHKTIEFPIEPDPAVVPWTAPEVWLTLKAVIQDHLQVQPHEITEDVTFLEGLGCD
ncbi:acyl carrier protein [Terriglobus aquaticus]|uniref:Acyl carrier protein n=1 Tax=Terriglobus aquaticus TaxID=940139 RepID=A0ABW9KN46_9BACT|nr:acyl carrier protein [Terriglobus aquaticus]